MCHECIEGKMPTHFKKSPNVLRLSIQCDVFLTNKNIPFTEKKLSKVVRREMVSKKVMLYVSYV